MRSFGTLNRPDPFFATATPHRTEYLESLHRTYGEPIGALPKRDEQQFARAMAFREKEKAKYRGIEDENTTLKAEIERLTATQTELREETERIKGLWEQLSKPTTDGVSTAPTTGADPGNPQSLPKRGKQPRADGAKRFVRTRGRPQRGGVVQPADDRVPDGGGAPVEERVENGGQQGGREQDDVRREVLPADVPDSRGQATEHATEGPERGGGADGPDAPVTGGPVRASEE